jgi:hypothetical protein
VLVDESAEPVGPVDRAGGRRRDRLCWLAGLGRSGAERAVRPMPVVVVDELAQAHAGMDTLLTFRPRGLKLSLRDFERRTACPFRRSMDSPLFRGWREVSLSPTSEELGYF